MRFAIFSDVHANLEALQSVLIDAWEKGCVRHICLGDIVGYNADPHKCVELIRGLNCPVVQGNHDEQAALDKLADPSGFNPLAEQALIWTRRQLMTEDKEWLASLPKLQEISGFTIVHATLDQPGKWGYIFSNLDAAASFSHQNTPLTFFGHTHAPRVYMRDKDGVQSRPLDPLKIETGKLQLINVGSVGQPRDGDWRAAYVIYDTEANLVELRRVEYDIELAKKKILAAGLRKA